MCPLCHHVCSWRILKDGTLYEGEVFADIPHGYGKAEYKNGDVYKGYWNRGQRSGQGVLIYNNGSVSEFRKEFEEILTDIKER